jgi:hypothetical protein
MATAFGMILGAVACVTVAEMARWRIVENVISKKPDSHRLGLIRWYSNPRHTTMLLREHRRLYPRSGLRLRYVLLFAAGIALGIGAWIL